RPARLLGVGRAAGAVARAEVLGVALVHGGATEHGRGLESVVRTRRAATRAGLRHVADARGGATGRPAVARRMLAGVARTVAGVGRAGVAVVGTGGPARDLRIGRAVGAVPGAEIVTIALGRRRAARWGRRRER